MSNTEYVLEMKGVVKEFPGVRALDGVNLKVRPGKVHIICGENGAGKSTLMKIINGTYVADAGEMYYKGQKVGARTVQDSLNMGIAMIYQELNPVLEMTIAENIWLGREPRKGAFVDYGKMYKDTQDLLDKLEIPYNAHQKMYELSIAGHQLVEITKAISCNASVIIMDEPSSAIGDEEIAVLFKQIFALKAQGVAILYITHKMDEIFKIADEITIIRDGKWIESGPASDYNPDKLVARMVGREITNVFPKDTTVPIGDVIFEVKDLTQNKEDGGRFRNINFQLRAGEILGFAGLVGAGRSELMRAIFGLDPISSGVMFLNGAEITNKDTAQAIKNGFAMVNEDRRQYGLVLGRSIHHNVSLVNMKKYTKGLIDDKAISKDVEEMRRLLQIKIANEDVEAGTLSGGNQQKVVLAKWLVGDVQVMILDEPTRGIDVGAKSEIHKLMTEFARQGMGIIMISSELPEVLGMSDRIIVMQEGIIQGILDRDEATQENIMALATKGVVKQ
ncbi:sugar ABC transporter ATP-binding protein [Butyricicoccus sp.]|uniref:sugar ABC transporter ATP-binding protein n=1 Tax=Butyricicoccus sp. TaxID=2049021 RepID=UPI003F1359AA